MAPTMPRPSPPVLRALQMLAAQPAHVDDAGGLVWVIWPERAGLDATLPALRLVVYEGGVHCAAIYEAVIRWLEFCTVSPPVVDSRAERYFCNAEIALDVTSSQVARRTFLKVDGQLQYQQLLAGCWGLHWWRPLSIKETLFAAENPKATLDRLKHLIPGLREFGRDHVDETINGEDALDLEEMTHEQLYAIAQRLEIRGRKGMNNATLRENIREALERANLPDAPPVDPPATGQAPDPLFEDA